MTTTQLIEVLKKIEFGASGRAREISIRIPRKNGKHLWISESDIKVTGTGDGIAGAEVTLEIIE
jgi:hypothetical protein